MGEYFVCFCGGLKHCCHLYVENVHSQCVFMIHVEAYHRVIMPLNGIKDNSLHFVVIYTPEIFRRHHVDKSVTYTV